MSTVTEQPRARRSPFSRKVDTGPRAKFRQLLPYLAEHRTVLALVIALSVVGAAASLLQPVLISQVIGLVQRATPSADWSGCSSPWS